MPTRLAPDATVWLKLPFVLIAVVFAALTLAFRSDLGVMQDFSPIERAALALYSLAYYAFALVVPIGLSPFHPYPQRVDGQLPMMTYVAALVFIGVVSTAWLWNSHRRLIAFGGLFFLINIVLVLKLVPLGVEFIADRYVYLSSIGLLLVIVELGRAPGPALRRAVIVTFAALAVWFSTVAYSRTVDWRDRRTFETRVLQRYPDDPDAHAGLGIALAEQGRLDEAVAHFSRASSIAPDNADTRVNLCATLQKLGRFETPCARTCGGSLAPAAGRRAHQSGRGARSAGAIGGSGERVHRGRAADPGVRRSARESRADPARPGWPLVRRRDAPPRSDPPRRQAGIDALPAGQCAG